jgi:hypothetical protein
LNIELVDDAMVVIRNDDFHAARPVSISLLSDGPPRKITGGDFLLFELQIKQFTATYPLGQVELLP